MEKINAEMLALLKQFVQFDEYKLIEVSATCQDGQAFYPWLEKVRALVAKVEG